MKKKNLFSPFDKMKPVKIKPETDDIIQFMNEEQEPNICKWCGGSCRPLNDNGIIGPGFASWNFACNDCGRVQSY